MFLLCLSSYRRTGLWCVVINYVVLCFSTCPGPPLTLENIYYVAIKAIRDWRKFGEKLLGWSIKKDLLDEIERQHVSTEARLKAVVESFLLGKGDYQPSWRRVIYVLHQSNQYQYVPDIKSYAEAVEGKCEWVITII